MLKQFKKIYSNTFFRLAFFVLALMTIFSYSDGHFIFVRAFSSQINILPGAFELESSDNDNIDFAWEEVANVFYQDLSGQASFNQFNKNNSAFILSIEEAYPDQDETEPDGNVDNSENIIIDNEFPLVLPEKEIIEDETEVIDNEDSILEPVVNNSENEEILPVEIETVEIIEDINDSEPVIEAVPETPEIPAETSEGLTSKNNFDLNLKKISNFIKNINIFRHSWAWAQNNIADSEDIISETMKPGIIFTDFSVPLNQQENNIGNIKIRLSLGANSAYENDYLQLFYEIGNGYKELGVIDLEAEISNNLNGDYFQFVLPKTITWDNIANLKIRLNYINSEFDDNNLKNLAIYLDALWLEIDYEDGLNDYDISSATSEEEVLAVETEEDFDIELNIISDKTAFYKEAQPKFIFKYEKIRKGLLDKIGAEILNIFHDEYKDLNIKPIVKNSLGKEVDSAYFKVNYLSDGEFEIELKQNVRHFAPGKFNLEVVVEDNGIIHYIEQDFEWGVLAFNTNKSIYAPAENAFLQMGVLDDAGRTLCDADLYLEIKAPDGGVAYLNTDNGLIKRNENCAGDTVIENPDYFAHYNTAGTGIYQVKLIAETRQGTREMYDYFEVRDYVPFVIERVGPTRIFPLADYEMRFIVKPLVNFQGEFTEIVPTVFKIKNKELVKDIIGDEKILSWSVDWQAEQEYELFYVFDAPDVSPEFYLLGPLRLADARSGQAVFIEARSWQIASDAVGTYQFTAGSGTGTWSYTADDSTSPWDTSDDTYAIRDIVKRSANEENTHYITGTTNNVPSESYSISKVWIGVEGYVEDITDVTLRFRPIFGAATSGIMYEISGANMGSGDDDNTDYVEITGDVNGPGTGNWDWNDVSGLDVKIWGLNTKNGQSRNMYVDTVKIQVEYTLPNDPPTAGFNSAAQKIDGSGAVDISIEADDPDDDDLRAKIEYEAGTSCTFSSPSDPTIDTTDVNVTADNGDPSIDNNNEYQIGTSSNLIETATGSNSVFFDWLSQTDVPTADGDYCLRLTLIDDDNATSSATTTTLTLDNTAPTSLGSLSVYATSGTAVVLTYGASTTETNFLEYIIYYKEYDGIDPAETDDSWASSSDSSLDYQNYNSATSTIITDLFPSTQYIFNIFAYDEYGNKASATTAVIATTSAQSVVPVLTINSLAQKTNGSGAVDISIEVNDGNDDDVRVKMEYVEGDGCNFSSALSPILDETDVNITADNGDPQIDNNSEYQIGTSTAWITATSSNTVLFDWLTANHAPALDGTYCVQFIPNDLPSGDGISATTTLTIDNTVPTAPGNLSVSTTTDRTATLNFGASSTEENFLEYKIFYKAAPSGVTESDSVYDQSDDGNLAYINYNSATTTTITGLLPQTQYVFNIFVYDQYGFKASANEIVFTTQDAEPILAKTVKFIAGTYSGSGSSGQSSDIDQNFAAFNFKLAEGNVEIKNAYIMFEAQFEAYANNAGSYSGYNLAFDVCEEPCVANAYSGSGRVLKDDNTVLAYDESESNQVRLFLDVTDETQLAAYSGNSTNMEGRVGYRIERGSVTNSIANTKAVLVITYTYNDNYTTDETNTVVFPLASNAAGDSGSRRNVQTDDCVLDSTCPLFTYKVDIPEFSAKLSQWYQMYAAIDRNSGIGQPYNDVAIDVNIEGEDVNSDTFIHELDNGLTQSHPPAMLFSNVYGFSENSTSTLEYRAYCSDNNVNIYLMGGEVFETYIASSSASVKIRTVSFPIGVVNNGLTTSQTSASVDVYFPENGAGSGIVSIKKAWLRVISNNYVGAGTITVSSQVGDNTQSSNYVYSYDTDTTVSKPSFNIIHIIPTADYSELAGANASSSKTITLYTTNSSATQGGLSAELMITYSYTSKSNGYLTNIDLFAGQSDSNGNNQLATTAITVSVLPEYIGEKSMYAGALLTSYLVSDSDGVVPTTAFTFDANLGTTTPTCTNAFNSQPNNTNIFTEFYKDVSSALTIIDNESYIVCYSNNGGSDTSAGAKMSGNLIYTYGWEAPPSVYEQRDWRWYENIDAIQPTTSYADENVVVNNINLADILRLRMNTRVSFWNLATTSQLFDLQFAEGNDCSSATGWINVGSVASTETWRFYNNPTVNDGSVITNTLLASSSRKESYQESTPSSLNPSSIEMGEQGEWGWVLYNYAASSSKSYCFRMLLGDGTIFDNYTSYAKLITAATNTAPVNPSSLGQFWNDGVTIIDNTDWINENNVKLKSVVTDVNINETLSFYYELIQIANNFTTATSVPSGACSYGTAYNSCGSKIWVATSTSGDYRVTAFIATTSITLIDDDSAGYKWQVLACDDSNECSDWIQPAGPPNFRVDITPPTIPGDLSLSTTTATSITVGFGATTTEDNFYRYRIFYKEGGSGVTEQDMERSDSNLTNILFNGATTTTIINLAAGTQYVFNIFAYDLAGNKASATVELVATTGSSFTEPTGSIFSAVQKADGSGGVDIAILVDDADNDDTLRAKIEYELGDTCAFSPGNYIAIDETDGNISATYGDPDVDTDYSYQVGTTTAWIVTSPGQNFVLFDWLSKVNIPDANSTYCLRLTVNDGVYDQITPHTKLLIVDNIPPSVPGALTLNSKNSTNIILNFGSQSSDPRFDKYRIFYSTSSPATINDYEHIDSNLDYNNYNTATTTTITNLAPNTLYYINIWAYDTRGNSASSTELATSTNAIPSDLTVINQYLDDEIITISNEAWINSSSTKLVASIIDADPIETPTLYFEFLADNDTFTTATTVPSNACVYGTAFGDCDSKVWFVAPSSPGDFSTNPYQATTSITNIPDSSLGYKWQVLACDDDDDCAASWEQFNVVTPNFYVDVTAPTSPGMLSEYTKSSRSVTLSYGAQTTEDNFFEYKIFYATSTPVTENSYLLGSSTDSNLGHKNYGSVATTSIADLEPDTTYYFSIWAYDKAGNKASSSWVTIATNAVLSTPGVLFYTKNSQVLYYKVWSGTDWGTESTGPTLGSATGDNIRHVRSLRSDDGKRIAILAKTWDGTNQEWWATVYRVAADDFVNSAQLGSAYASADNNQLITGCMAALSESEFFIVRNNNGANGTLIYSWNATDGWIAETAGPDPSGVVNGCRLIRRPDTDNYLLTTFDDTNHGGQQIGDVGTAYYYGGSTYANSWTTWTEHSTSEEDANNYVGEAFFDPSDNARGAINYSNSNSAASAKVKKFICTDSTINYGVEATSPVTWSGAFAHGEFGVDPGGVGTAYYIGDDVNGEVNVYKVVATSSTPVWTVTTNGDNISGSGLYAYTNDSQKPYAISFYEDNNGVVAWNENIAATPKYRFLDADNNSVYANNTAVPGAAVDIYTRVRFYEDPTENEFIAIYQDDDADFSAIFWNAVSAKFYNSTDDPGSTQVWTELVTAAGALDVDDENTTFAFSAGNSSPSSPSNLTQYKSNASTVIANGAWTDESTVKFEISSKDSDTSEILTTYLQLITNNDDFATTTGIPGNTCASTTIFTNCNSKIWQVATSTSGDYSVNPFVATATIASIPNSSAGYKWQVKTCDDSDACSAWIKYNTTIPNFKVDTIFPTSPGSLTIVSKTSTAVTLGFGATSTEDNFLEYKIFYSTSTPVTETDYEHDDSDLDNIYYSYTADTVVISLDPSTLYYFNIFVYDEAGNSASSSSETATTTNDTYKLIQTSYLLENDDGANVNSNTAEVAVDTALNNLNKGERLNARIQIENIGGDIASSKTYKLQFENQTDNPGTWTDVGAVTEISYSSGLSGTNGSIINLDKAVANSNSWVDGTWHEDTNQTGSFSLTNDYYTEFVFAIETSNALLGKTYRLRLFNNTDSSLLNGYLSTSTISIITPETKRYSKDAYASLPSDTADLSYYLDPEGYADVLVDDNTNRDEIVSNSNYPVALFATKHVNNTDAIQAVWNGQSSMAFSTSSAVLQVYRFGATNAWVTMKTNSTSSKDTDIKLSIKINSFLSQYYDGSNWTYWRIYQDVESANLKTDYFSVSFSAPDPFVNQVHYRWRADNGTETTADWYEDEDVGSPIASSSIDIGENVRLRIEMANTGGGTASNYIYRLEYASTTGNCSDYSGSWATVPTDNSEHWRMGSSTYFADSDDTTAQFDNTESYSFVTGDMVEEFSNSSGAISLTELDYTEIEYIIKATNNAVAAGTYCFRVTNAGTPLNDYDIFPVLTLAGVTNTAPGFTTHPSDNGSASTSPTNYGNDIDFTATALDGEGDKYYLAICKTNSISAGNDGPPTCNGGSWCISDLATSSEETNCSYTAATSSEILSWYGFVCDKYPGFAVAKCSAYSQGNGSLINNSPFSVNHPPVFTSVSTTDNNKDPGEIFTITTVSVDNDIAYTSDTLYLYVCRTNSASFTGCTAGAGDTVCQATATSSPNASCKYDDTYPTPAGDYTYYTFLYDSHGLAATTNSQSSTYTVNNISPSLGTCYLNSGDNIILNIRPTDTVVRASTTLVDLNGCEDLVSATAIIYMSATTSSCSGDDNVCYQVGTGDCVISDCSGSTDTSALYTCTSNFKYFATPTDGSTNNPNASYDWLAYINIYDGSNYIATTSPGVTLNTGSALDVWENLIDFGNEIDVGKNSGTENATSTIINAGNSPINTNISGTDMVGNPSGTIDVDNLKWSLAMNFNYIDSGTPLNIGGAEVDILATKATTTNHDSADVVYWGIGIPPTADASTYDGQNNFSVIFDSNSW